MRRLVRVSAEPDVPCRIRISRIAADRVMSSSLAPIAQSVERLHGKEKVYGSIPYWGSDGSGPRLVGGGRFVEAA
ncbi:hypothetical protein SCOCK_120067 [Actinacidiphila cocklensis]|uniref:Uncharacterized protein n=1 Tax=Actinacidiphila cocklensis TaxID=887465 RepID=A0A9W4DQ06_9ACTN|nr:hypothetical protein SCOCK_120067 [Actinacidiphila cocklensis]